MRTAEDIYSSVQDDFKTLTGKEFRQGSAIGYYTSAVSRAMEQAHQEIEDAKNPHIYTNLAGDNLDKMGTFVNVPRRTDESDTNYIYRVMNWTYLKAGANLNAVNDSLLDMENASDAQYYPGIYGAGTGVVYVIPNDYSDETIENALQEAKDRIHDVISPESYTEYIVPTPIPVTIVATLTSEEGDVDYLKQIITNEVGDYINSIAPNDYLRVGTINRLGIEQDNVDYFVVDGLYVNEAYVSEKNIMQNLETKFLFQEISWEE